MLTTVRLALPLSEVLGLRGEALMAATRRVEPSHCTPVTLLADTCSQLCHALLLDVAARIQISVWLQYLGVPV